MNHFERLGLPRRFDLNLAELEASYLARSREVHPDFHGFKSGLEQMASLELSSTLNEAYQTLREPLRRAEYLLSLETEGPQEVQKMSPSFLEEMLELRMQISELQMEAIDHPELMAIQNTLEARLNQLIQDLGQQFQLLETEPNDRNASIQKIREIIQSTRYIQGLMMDI